MKYLHLAQGVGAAVLGAAILFLHVAVESQKLGPDHALTNVGYIGIGGFWLGMITLLVSGTAALLLRPPGERSLDR